MSASAAPHPGFSSSWSAWQGGGYAAVGTPRRRDPARLQQLAGRTMGTHWTLRLDNPRMVPLDTVRAAVEGALDCVVAQMSHWDAHSMLSAFNEAPAGSVHRLPPAFARVMACAMHWAEASGGALDPTVGALVARWGFGPQGDTQARKPSPAQVDAALAHSGWRRLQFDAVTACMVQPGGVQLDLSGVAKGFAVDLAAEAVHALGIEGLLMEIGGELRAVGTRPGGQPWRVALDGAPGDPAVALTDVAIATSGDRWHRRSDGARHWSHTLDPRTGQPAAGDLAAVTVVHAQCMQADALATVLRVLGMADGPAFARAHDVAALWAPVHGPLAANEAWLARFGPP